MMRKFLTGLALVLSFVGSAFAQLSPGLRDGQVPTAAQWNSFFAAKQNVLGFTPLSIAGGTITGNLVVTGTLTAGSLTCATCAFTNASNTFTQIQRISNTTDITEPAGPIYTPASGALQVQGGLSVYKFAQFGGRIFIGDGTSTTGFNGMAIINMNGYNGGTGGTVLDMDLSANTLAMRIGNFSASTNNLLGGFDPTPTYMSGMPNGAGIAHRFVRAVNGNPPVTENLWLNIDQTAQLFGRLSITPASGTGTPNQGLVVSQTLPSSGTATGPLLLNSITVANPGTSTTGGGLNWDAFGQIQNQVNALRINFATSGTNGTNNGALSVANFVTAPAESYGAAIGVTINGNATTSHNSWGVIGYATAWPGSTIGPLIGMEAEVGISNGGSATYRIGVGVNTQGPVQGSTLDAAFMASSGGVTVPGSAPDAIATPWQHLMALVTNIFGPAGSPITTSGDFFFSESPVTIAHFANLPNVTITGRILDFPSMAIYGNGSASFGIRGLSISPGVIYSSCSSCGNVQIAASADGVNGANGTTVFDSAGTNTMFAGVAEASNTNVRFGKTTGNWGEVVSLGTTSNGLLIGSLTSDPVVFGTNNLFAGQVTNGQQWSFGSSAAPTTGPILTLNGNTTTPLSAFFGTKQLQIVAPDSTIGGLVIDTYAQQGVAAMRATNGTLALPTAVAAVTVIGSYSWQSWDGVSAYGSVAAIDGITLNLQSATDHSGRLRFRTVPNGTATLVEAGSFQADGSLTIGAGTGSAGAGNINLGGGSLLNNGLAPVGSGAYVRATSTTLVTPNLGTPSAIILTNATGLPTTALTGTLQAAQEPAHTGDVTNTAGSLALTLATAQPAVHTWALAQTFTVASVFTDASGSRTALGLGTMATVSSTAGGDLAGTFPSPTINNAPVIAKVLTAYSASAGTVAATDSILQGFQKLGGLVDNAAWNTFTPTVSSTGGTLASTGTTVIGAQGRYKQIGKTVFAEMSAGVTVVGTASGNWFFTLPVTASGLVGYSGSSFESAVTGRSGGAIITAGTPTLVSARQADTTTYWTTNYTVVVSITYEVP